MQISSPENYPFTVKRLSCSLELSAIDDNDWLLGLVVSVDWVSLDGVENFKAINALAEDDVGTVEMRGIDEAKEELGAVGSWASVGHGEDAATCVLVDEVLVLELTTVDGCATSAVHGSEVSALGHEVGDDSVEGAVLEVERDTSGGLSLLACAESAEVLRGLWCVSVELDGNAAGCLSTDRDVVEDLGVLSWGSHFDVKKF